MTLAERLRQARRRLAEAGIATPELDARLLLESATGAGALDMIREPDRRVAAEQIAVFEAAMERRLAGEPVHRILGWREFYGLRLSLSADTLEPRPDTETLVDLVLAHVRRRAWPAGRPRMIDLGTGTGAIALALLSSLPGARALGVDLSAGALETAAANAASLGLSERFETARSDWFEKISGRFDVILSNPPYITENEYAGLDREVALHDPVLALVGGADGLDAYRSIARAARDHLEADGIAVVEIGSGQIADVTELFARSGLRLIEAGKDLGGHERALIFAV